jgi:hypothetical protein
MVANARDAKITKKFVISAEEQKTRLDNIVEKLADG